MNKTSTQINSVFLSLGITLLVWISASFLLPFTSINHIGLDPKNYQEIDELFYIFPSVLAGGIALLVLKKKSVYSLFLPVLIGLLVTPLTGFRVVLLYLLLKSKILYPFSIFHINGIDIMLVAVSGLVIYLSFSKHTRILSIILNSLFVLFVLFFSSYVTHLYSR